MRTGWVECCLGLIYPLKDFGEEMRKKSREAELPRCMGSNNRRQSANYDRLAYSGARHS